MCIRDSADTVSLQLLRLFEYQTMYIDLNLLTKIDLTYSIVVLCSLWFAHLCSSRLVRLLGIGSECYLPSSGLTHLWLLWSPYYLGIRSLCYPSSSRSSISHVLIGPSSHCRFTSTPSSLLVISSKGSSILVISISPAVVILSILLCVVF